MTIGMSFTLGSMIVLVVVLAIVVVCVAVAVAVTRRNAGAGIVEVPSLPAAAPTGDLEADARALLANGKTIQAIKLVRERSGMDLGNAKQYVDALRTGEPVSLTPGTAPADLATIQDELQQLLAQGHQIEAIKRVRQHTGWGLKQAKDYVDSLRF